MIKILFNVPTPENTEIISGWAGDKLDQLGNAITNGIYNGFISIVSTLCDIAFWGTQIGILSCIIIYNASKDQKAISNGVKLALIFIIAAVVKSSL